MAEDSPSELMKAAAELAKAVPIYQDALQPGARELGRTFGAIGRAGNALLLPILDLIVTLGEEKVRRFCRRVARKMEEIPQAERHSPDVNVIGLALEGVRYTDDEGGLEEMFANLIASAMDKRVEKGVLRSFVEIVKALSSDEAKILRTISNGGAVPIVRIQQESFNDAGERLGGLDVEKNLSLIGIAAGCEYSRQTPAYLDNLARLRLIEFHTPGTYYCQFASNRDPLFASNRDPSGDDRNGLIPVVHRRDPRASR